MIQHYIHQQHHLDHATFEQLHLQNNQGEAQPSAHDSDPAPDHAAEPARIISESFPAGQRRSLSGQYRSRPQKTRKHSPPGNMNLRRKN